MLRTQSFNDILPADNVAEPRIQDHGPWMKAAGPVINYAFLTTTKAKNTG